MSKTKSVTHILSCTGHPLAPIPGSRILSCDVCFDSTFAVLFACYVVHFGLFCFIYTIYTSTASITGPRTWLGFPSPRLHRTCLAPPRVVVLLLPCRWLALALPPLARDSPTRGAPCRSIVECSSHQGLSPGQARFCVYIRVSLLSLRLSAPRHTAYQRGNR